MSISILINRIAFRLWPLLSCYATNHTLPSKIVLESLKVSPHTTLPRVLHQSPVHTSSKLWYANNLGYEFVSSLHWIGYVYIYIELEILEMLMTRCQVAFGTL